MGNGCRKKVRNVKIKKVDDKPMVIHTKQKATIHTKNAKETKINDVFGDYTASRI